MSEVSNEPKNFDIFFSGRKILRRITSGPNRGSFEVEDKKI